MDDHVRVHPGDWWALRLSWSWFLSHGIAASADRGEVPTVSFVGAVRSGRLVVLMVVVLMVVVLMVVVLMVVVLMVVVLMVVVLMVVVLMVVVLMAGKVE
jgi:hypothetical protein